MLKKCRYCTNIFYLVKIGVKLVKAMEDHEDEDEDLQDDDSTNDTVDIDALNEEDLD